MTYEQAARALWDLLDDIDTNDDACRSDDYAFRVRVRRIVSKRHECMTSDGLVAAQHGVVNPAQTELLSKLASATEESPGGGWEAD